MTYRDAAGTSHEICQTGSAQADPPALLPALLPALGRVPTQLRAANLLNRQRQTDAPPEQTDVMISVRPTLNSRRCWCGRQAFGHPRRLQSPSRKDPAYLRQKQRPQ